MTPFEGQGSNFHQGVVVVRSRQSSSELRAHRKDAHLSCDAHRESKHKPPSQRRCLSTPMQLTPRGHQQCLTGGGPRHVQQISPSLCSLRPPIRSVALNRPHQVGVYSDCRCKECTCLQPWPVPTGVAAAQLRCCHVCHNVQLSPSVVDACVHAVP